jgi:hypothetical protein
MELRVAPWVVGAVWGLVGVVMSHHNMVCMGGVKN